MSLTMLQVVLPSKAEGPQVSFIGFISLLFQQLKGYICDSLVQFYLQSNTGRFLEMTCWLYQQPRVSQRQG